MTDYKSDFPIFKNNPDIIYLDSGASAQKPECVIDAISHFSKNSYANIHRGLYSLSLASTELVEKAREKTAYFLGTNPENLIFTKNGTEASNIFCYAFAAEFLKEGDEVLISAAEHHANFLPWQRACARTKAKLVVVHPDANGVFTALDFKNKITDRTKIIVFAHVSNVTGQIFPLQPIVSCAKEKGVYTMIDACQSVPHLDFDFTELGVDAAFFTAHKFGAGGCGGLIISDRFKNILQPMLWGGDMVSDVTETSYTLLEQPSYLESGTPAIENLVGLGACIDYLKNIGMQSIRDHEHEILSYGLSEVSSKLPNWKVVGPQDPSIRSGNISLYHPNIHHLDVGMILAEKNIAVRTGFHCANPLHHYLQCSGTVRASVWIYTTKSDIDAFITALQEIETLFSR